MQKFAVFLATTGGPVQIERLTPERAPQSMMCISRSSTSLPVSAGYHDFVKRGTGIIEREFGSSEYNSFRADVSGPVDSGESWQLAFYLAHAIEVSQNAELTSNLEDADHVIWATGIVDYDLNILAVGHMAEKLQASQQLFDNLSAGSLRVTMLTSTAQSEDLPSAEELGSNFEHLSLEDARRTLEMLTLEIPAKTKPLVDDIKPIKSKVKPIASVVGGCFIAICLLLLWSTERKPYSTWRNHVLSVITPKQQQTAPSTTRPTHSTKSNKPVPDKSKELNKNSQQIDPPQETPNRQDQKITVTVSALGPPKGGHCKDIVFTDLQPTERVLQYAGPGIIKTERLKKVCRLSFSINETRAKRYVAIFLKEISGRYIRISPLPRQLLGSTIFTSRQSWTIEVPLKLSRSFEYRLIVISGKSPVAKELKRLKKSSNWRTTANNLSRKGIDFMETKHRLDP